MPPYNFYTFGPKTIRTGLNQWFSASAWQQSDPGSFVQNTMSRHHPGRPWFSGSGAGWGMDIFVQLWQMMWVHSLENMSTPSMWQSLPSNVGTESFCILSFPSHKALVSSVVYGTCFAHLSSFRSPSLNLTFLMCFLNTATEHWTQSCRCGLSSVEWNSPSLCPDSTPLLLQPRDMFASVMLYCCLILEVRSAVNCGTF